MLGPQPQAQRLPELSMAIAYQAAASMLLTPAGMFWTCVGTADVTETPWPVPSWPPSFFPRAMEAPLPARKKVDSPPAATVPSAWAGATKGAAGVTGLEGADSGPVPTPFVAATVKV